MSFSNKISKLFLGLSFLLLLNVSLAQKISRSEKKLIKKLHSHIEFLADDKLEGRRTGTKGEKLAYEYIAKNFASAKFIPKGDNNSYIQGFPVYDGKTIDSSSYLIINENILNLEKDYFPFAFSSNASAEASTALALQEKGSIWLVDIKYKIEEYKNNPHFEWANIIKALSNGVAQKGASALILYNSGNEEDLKYEPKEKIEVSKIPVLYIKKETIKNYLKNKSEILDIKLKVSLSEKKRTGHNVIGFIDNKAKNTIVIGAHYDHLGYGEDHNSRHVNDMVAVHNGADDNASGTAAVIELGKMLKKSKQKNYNYLLMCFSGEELGLFGSKYFTEHSSIELSTINYMINMDMVGRLNDTNKILTIGGFGTSPSFSEVVLIKPDFFSIKIDSSGTGPSDHTSFYRKDIPVLFFFTGLHSDYHKPSDDANKINYYGEARIIKYIYDIISALDQKPKLSFTKTREVAMSGKSNFKVTLGIMPDYTFSGNGVKVDGVSDGKPAQKAGIKAGDILTQLGEFSFSDMQSYMTTLNKFKKGDTTKVKVKRKDEILTFDITF